LCSDNMRSDNELVMREFVLRRRERERDNEKIPS
jgi:hypothetical protein